MHSLLIEMIMDAIPYEEIVEFIKSELLMLVRGYIPLEKLVITKTLERGYSSASIPMLLYSNRLNLHEVPSCKAVCKGFSRSLQSEYYFYTHIAHFDNNDISPMHAKLHDFVATFTLVWHFILFTNRSQCLMAFHIRTHTKSKKS